MENKRDSFIFYRSFFEAISDLPKKDRLPVYEAIAELGLNFTETGLKNLQKTIFKLIKPQLDANNRRWLNGQKGASHGIKGGRPKPQDKPLKEPQENPKKTPNSNVNSNVNSNIKKGALDWFLEFMNITLNRKFKSYDKNKLLARLKTFDKDEIKKAILRASQDTYHIEKGLAYLTPDYFLRSDKYIDKWINAPPEKVGKSSNSFMDDMNNPRS